MPLEQHPSGVIAVVVKGYPRLSETFIAQEILALEARGLPLAIWSLRHPTEKAVHPMHKKIKARPNYLPEYLYQEPLRVAAGFLWGLRQRTIWRMLGTFWRDLKRDMTANRGRRLGQAFVLARELPAHTGHLHVHYLHTPASVVRYAALLRGLTFSFSAHAKDIWTTPDWDIREKITDSAWGVTCTRDGHIRLSGLSPSDASRPGRVELVYHGLDLSRFPTPPQRPPRDGSDPADPVRIVTVGRAVAKKGFDDLLAALAALPDGLHWQFVHIGGGELLGDLKQQAAREGIAGRVAFLGAKAQPDVITMMREADLFVLPAKEAKSGDRDGLPNVLMEAASQELAIVASDFAGIPEFLRDGREGVLVPPGRWDLLANAINLLARDPKRRALLGQAAASRLARDFSMEAGIELLAAKFRAQLGEDRAPSVDGDGTGEAETERALVAAPTE
ncbi:MULTISPECIES: glycosyltransferase family 4 protein [unclassified Chelatococcus]|uniref:glycosyltransferase family 4 protein n=1 Tax=unclassified Chelatococcus TaxID=2638111 RepID=UPI001BCC7760|nr:MULTISPECIES: glycosyltransferase family 4 protein [unclassified Chelatococcus]CAH1669191.1 Glycosyltransferase involved in cell wall biosynthesis [Hyphomicrobiales bacterium]MBS7739367.1 glycosyltransferase family 4 protein [Chelatococcus sp. HY11]MBX3546848.1 glycosyltransferase family 4 protein [Chelatococcus sp.]MCO5076098.1 glycosyltransferase family 4 protein [Chelatococcus sp.]CAH1679352.1 Glycosyltransferase involved in cell wall biosynthesis [Hyphomicrobiales bacterium]